MRSPFALMSCAASISLQAQTIPLNGSIAVQNSRYTTGTRQYVQGASIRAPFSKATTTDADGQFALVFTGVDAGATVRLMVNKTGLAVVNQEEIEHVVVGRATALNVVMVDPTKLEAAELELHGILVRSIEEDLQRKLAILRDTTRALNDRLSAVRIQKEDSITSLRDAMGLASDQREVALAKVALLAREMALVDLDVASSRYTAAYELLRKGDLDAVLVSLDRDVLDAEYGKATENKKKGKDVISRANEGIRQVYQSYDLKALVLSTRSQLRECLAVLNTMDAIIAEQFEVFSAREKDEVLLKRATVLNDLARYAEARALLKDLLDRAGPTVAAPIIRADAYHLVAEMDEQAGHFTEALAAAEHALALRMNALGADSLPVAVDLAMVGRVLLSQGRLDDAIVPLRKAEALVEASAPADPRFAIPVWNTMGSYHQDRMEMPVSIEYQRRMEPLVIAMNDKAYLASFNNNLAVAFSELAEADSAIARLQKSLALAEGIYGPDHPRVANTIQNMARVFDDVGSPEQALPLFERALAVQRRLLGNAHPELTPTLMNYAMNLEALERPADALVAYNEAIRILRNAPEADPLDLANAIANTAQWYRHQDRCDTAIVMMEEAIGIFAGAYGMDNVKVADPQRYIGACLDSLGRYVEAAAAFRKAITTYEKELPREHIRTLTTRLACARAYLLANQLDQARKVANEALADRPTGGVYWTLYTIERAAGNKAIALEHVMACYRTRMADPNAGEQLRSTTRETAKTLALELGDAEVLKELDPP